PAGGCPGKLLSPARRRACVEQVRAQLHVSERPACAALGQHRSTQRKIPRGRDDEQNLLAALALDRKKLATFSAAAGRFLQFPIGDRRCNRTRASVGNAGGNARPSLTNATLAASRLLHRRSPTAPCSKGALAAHRKKLAAFSALGGE